MNVLPQDQQRLHIAWGNGAESKGPKYRVLGIPLLCTIRAATLAHPTGDSSSSISKLKVTLACTYVINAV